MTILRGHEDLKPKAILGWDMGFALVQCGDTVKRYRVTIGAGGGFHGEPVEENAQGVDQLRSERTEAEPDLRARSMANIDQL